MMNKNFKITMALAFSLLLISGCTQSDEKQILRNDSIVNVVGEYKGWACGDFTPQIMPIEGLEPGLNIENVKYGFEFWIPSDIPAPDHIDALRVPGNKFSLKGYYFYTVKNGVKFLEPKFDLLEWRPLPQAMRWQKSGTQRTSLSPNEYANTSKQSPMVFKIAGKYDSGCR
jgi:hypothetical protein